MEKKTLNIFILVVIFLMITILAISFIKIEKYENCLLYQSPEQTKIVLKKEIYNDIKKNKNVYFLMNKNSYEKKVIRFYKENNSYLCIIQKIDNLNEQIANISLKIKDKTIFDF